MSLWHFVFCDPKSWVSHLYSCLILHYSLLTSSRGIKYLSLWEKRTKRWEIIKVVKLMGDKIICGFLLDTHPTTSCYGYQEDLIYTAENSVFTTSEESDSHYLVCKSLLKIRICILLPGMKTLIIKFWNELWIMRSDYWLNYTILTILFNFNRFKSAFPVIYFHCYKSELYLTQKGLKSTIHWNQYQDGK